MPPQRWGGIPHGQRPNAIRRREPAGFSGRLKIGDRQGGILWYRLGSDLSMNTMLQTRISPANLDLSVGTVHGVGPVQTGQKGHPTDPRAVFSHSGKCSTC
jgi:hypothetical protein